MNFIIPGGEVFFFFFFKRQHIKKDTIRKGFINDKTFNWTAKFNEFGKKNKIKINSLLMCEVKSAKKPSVSGN